MIRSAAISSSGQGDTRVQPSSVASSSNAASGDGKGGENVGLVCRCLSCFTYAGLCKLHDGGLKGLYDPAWEQPISC